MACGLLLLSLIVPMVFDADCDDNADENDASWRHSLHVWALCSGSCDARNCRSVAHTVTLYLSAVQSAVSAQLVVGWAQSADHLLLEIHRWVSNYTKYLFSIYLVYLPSVHWHCWLGGRKGIWPVKTEWWDTGVVICLEWGANDLHTVQLMPLPPHHLLLQ